MVANSWSREKEYRASGKKKKKRKEGEEDGEKWYLLSTDIYLSVSLESFALCLLHIGKWFLKRTSLKNIKKECIFLIKPC